MTLIRPIVVVPLSLMLALWSGCQGGEDKPADEAVKPQTGMEQPRVEKPAVATQPPAAAVEEVEADCFVIVDAEPDFGAPPLKVQFETEIDCTAEPVTYSWDFGDGTTGGNEANPTHVYDKPGDYIATVITKSPDGGEGEDEIDITVDAEMAE